MTSVFGPVRVTRMAYRNRREPNLYPADARLVLPGDPYSLGMRALAAFHLAAGGFGQAQEVIEARTGVTVLGKSRLPEFGFSASTEFVRQEPTRNPWHVEYFVGASSGGSWPA